MAHWVVIWRAYKTTILGRFATFDEARRHAAECRLKINRLMRGIGLPGNEVIEVEQEPIDGR